MAKKVRVTQAYIAMLEKRWGKPYARRVAAIIQDAGKYANGAIEVRQV